MIKSLPTALGLFIGFYGPAFAQSPQPVLLDSTGKVLGPYNTASGTVILTLKNGQAVQAPAGPAGFLSQRNTLQYLHTTPDCSGTRYLGFGNDVFMLAYPLVTKTAALLVNPGPRGQTLMITSTESYNTNNQTFSCDAFPPASLTVAQIVVTQLDTIGTPPFSGALR